MAVVFGIFIGGLLGLALYYIISGGDGDLKKDDNKSGIVLEDVLSGQLSARRFNGSWTSGSNFVFRKGNVS